MSSVAVLKLSTSDEARRDVLLALQGSQARQVHANQASCPIMGDHLS